MPAVLGSRAQSTARVSRAFDHVSVVSLLACPQAINYDTPLHMVRGEGCRLYDYEGREYLDCVNNVAHVGHSHPQARRSLASLKNLLTPLHLPCCQISLVSHAVVFEVCVS